MIKFIVVISFIGLNKNKIKNKIKLINLVLNFFYFLNYLFYLINKLLYFIQNDQKVYNKVIGMFSFISFIRNNIALIESLTIVCLSMLSYRLAFIISNTSSTEYPSFKIFFRAVLSSFNLTTKI